MRASSSVQTPSQGLVIAGDDRCDEPGEMDLPLEGLSVQAGNRASRQRIGCALGGSRDPDPVEVRRVEWPEAGRAAA